MVTKNPVWGVYYLLWVRQSHRRKATSMVWTIVWTLDQVGSYYAPACRCISFGQCIYNESRTHVSSAWVGVTYIWMISGYWAGHKTMLCMLACVRRRQICICRHMFMISEESASRCHMCTSYEDSTAMNRDQCHCIYAIVFMLTCLKATSYDLDSNPWCMKFPDGAWFTWSVACSHARSLETSDLQLSACMMYKC